MIPTVYPVTVAETASVVEASSVAESAGSETTLTVGATPAKESEFALESSPALSQVQSTKTPLFASPAAVVVATTVPRQDKIALIAEGRPPYELAPVWVSLTTGRTYPVSKVRWVSIAQHSMTSGQEKVYEAIWHSKSDYRFQVETINRHTRRFCAGYDVLSRVCRLAPRNVQINIPSLIQKQILFSYRNHDSNIRKGTTYDIYSYEEILRRQRCYWTLLHSQKWPCY